MIRKPNTGTVAVSRAKVSTEVKVVSGGKVKSAKKSVPVRKYASGVPKCARKNWDSDSITLRVLNKDKVKKNAEDAREKSRKEAAEKQQEKIKLKRQARERLLGPHGAELVPFDYKPECNFRKEEICFYLRPGSAESSTKGRDVSSEIKNAQNNINIEDEAIDYSSEILSNPCLEKFHECLDIYENNQKVYLDNVEELIKMENWFAAITEPDNGDTLWSLRESNRKRHCMSDYCNKNSRILMSDYKIKNIE